MAKLIAIIVGFLGLIAVAVLLSTLFIKIGWALFMEPVFGLRAIGWLEAYGFGLLASCFKATSWSSK